MLDVRDGSRLLLKGWTCASDGGEENMHSFCSSGGFFFGYWTRIE